MLSDILEISDTCEISYMPDISQILKISEIGVYMRYLKNYVISNIELFRISEII